MAHRTLQQCVADLDRHGRLLRVTASLDARWEVAEVQRRVFASGGPALLFTNVPGCRFPLLSNLFGTLERAQFLFRDTLDAVRRLIELKIEPAAGLRHPLRYWRTPWTALTMLPQRVRRAAVTAHQIAIQELPQVVSWPGDGGAFITLPQVYTEHAEHPGWRHANLGMYRVQLSSPAHEPGREIGLHYQIHRGIGVHHAAALRAGRPFRVNIFVGGAPAMTLAAVMPLPEGLSELTFAGALAGQRIPLLSRRDGPPIYAEADFCIQGTLDADRLAPEGPFGDHLGYYSLAHPFPVLRVERVWRRDDAIWPFTVVGRPPQEDTVFGELIHELTAPIIPTVVPGVKAVHAVDAAGVHPLLLAIGSERYTPYHRDGRPAELLTQANALLGQGQLSLAKYLLIVDQQDDPKLDLHDSPAFFRHVLERVDWSRDLHFQTCTTIDTLDYSGTALNEGSKVVIAAAGAPRRALAAEWPAGVNLPPPLAAARICAPGIAALQGPDWRPDGLSQLAAQLTAANSSAADPLSGFPLLVLVDDSEFVARSWHNFLWVVFTRSDPARDVGGLGAFIQDKHWGCRGPLLIDARSKPHHAPPLIEDPQVTRKIDALAARGGPLGKLL